MPAGETIAYALIGGVLPALVWLDFLLQEDRRCPEPRWLVAVAFIVGMVCVPLVIPLEHIAYERLPEGLPTIIAWSMIEETMKYLLAAIFVLSHAAARQSTHIVTSMITVALGFAAAENAFFLIDPISQGQFIDGLVTGNLRFVGATLLHVVASSAIGFALAFSLNSSRRVRMAAASFGLILAIALHALFNYFIIQEDGSHTLLAFFTVWTGAVVFFAAFEVLKYFRYRNLPANTCET
ncbi:PrsW family intramembrane metalloprotease [Patescibacteria group bacterium]|nr:PrsW family intramembrane metalloprotease [Patescibacteria group bacterium]